MRRSATSIRDNAVVPYKAYAVSADGSRLPIDARSIVVDLGAAEVEIHLVVASPILAGRLNVAARSGGVLVLGPGDGGSVCVAVEPFGGARLRS